jgi:hypothetical protein
MEKSFIEIKRKNKERIIEGYPRKNSINPDNG